MYGSYSIRIVYYHLISNNNIDYYFKNKSITTSEFERQILFYKRNFDIISLSKAVNLASKRLSLKGKLVITFDDGFHENFKNVLPILTKHKISATFFLITKCIDNKHIMWRNKILLIEKYAIKKNMKDILMRISSQYLLKYKKQNLLDWSYTDWPMSIKDEIADKIWESVMPFDQQQYLSKNEPYIKSNQVLELINNGFEVGSHSHSHPIFSKLNYEEFCSEIEISSSILSNITGNKINFFSYPFGDRAKKSFEKKFLTKSYNNWIFLGTKNSLNNNYNNYNFWERDNVEFERLRMGFRFFILPIFRSLLKK